MPSGSKDHKTVYRCSECGHGQSKWSGRCPGCGKWNTLQEGIEDQGYHRRGRLGGYAGAVSGEPQEPIPLAEIEAGEIVRAPTGFSELDRVFGGGLVKATATLIGGDPGVGKSTLLLQMVAALGANRSVLYTTGEESLQQMSLRAKRLQISTEGVQVLAETRLEEILRAAIAHRPEVLVVDSIQTVFSAALASAPGSVAQVRECAAQLVRFAKQKQVMLFLIGHVTKEGALAGPRVLEHMVDTVLYFEGDSNSRYRIIRAVKNRFGAVNELGIFAMTETGLREVRNPSAIFLSRQVEALPGSVVTVMREGSRPLLLEVQALVDECHGPSPRRVAVGMDPNRLAMLLAILHRHGSMAMFNQDVFVNFVGGLRLNETSGDLAVALAVLSSYRDRPIPRQWLAFGELGLNGEVRPVPNGEERLREAAKHGFKHAIAPAQNMGSAEFQGLEVIPVRSLAEAIAAI